MNKFYRKPIFEISIFSLQDVLEVSGKGDNYTDDDFTPLDDTF